MLLTKRELDLSAKLHPQIAEFIGDNPRPQQPGGPEDVRAGLKMLSAAILAKIGPPPAGMSETYRDIPMRDGYNSSLKIHKPIDGPAGPLIVLAYGGGFVGGDNDQLSDTARALVKLFGATVVNISYRHAPENRFPASQYDAWDSMKWVATNATNPELGADPSKGFIMGGVSAGGCLTACLSRKFQVEKLEYPLTGQWLCIAALMDLDSCPDKYKSYFVAPEQNAVNPTLSKESLDMLKSTTGWNMNDELHCAAKSETALADQPRTYFQVAGMDMLRDDGLIYEEMLKEAGVSTKIDLYPGCPHGHMVMAAGTEVAKDTNIDTILGFGWLLEKPVSRTQATNVLGYN